MSQDAEIFNYGPTRDNYYDGMFLELTKGRFDYVKEKGFDANMLGHSGFSPLPDQGQQFQSVRNAWESGSVWNK